jgi:hypothetical protein
MKSDFSKPTLEKKSKISICALVQGWYGHRMVSNIKKRIPKDWTIHIYEFQQDLPIFVDEPMELLPKDISEFDLVLSLGENPVIATLIPDLVKISGAKAALIPIDNSDWVPPGIKKQISEELEKMDVAFIFPKPFCSMESNSKNRMIDDFAKIVGKPELRMNLKNGIIEEIDVIRGAPCGATHFVAQKLLDTDVLEAPVKASLFVQTYPCLASRMKDPELGKSLIHLAAYITKGSILKSLSESK